MDSQFWLAELDRYGNPKLVDGAHSGRDGAEEAAAIIQRLGLARGRKFAVAEVILTDLTGEHPKLNDEAIATLNALRPHPNRTLPHDRA